MTSNSEWWMENDLPPESSGTALPLTVLTNRMNVMEILSTRLVKPRAGYGIYYADHLEDAEGWIPVFRSPVAAGVAARAAAEDPAAFPVLVSVPSLPPDARALAPDLWVTRQVIALETLEVHFRSAPELEEFKARKFANLPEDVTYRVSPELFSGTADSDELQRAIGNLAAYGGLNEADFVREDRISGALAIGAWAARTMNSPEGGRAPSAGHIGDLVPWLPGALLGHVDIVGDTDSLEVAVYTAVRDTIQETPRGNGWNPRALLLEIKGRALGGAGGLEAEKSLSRYFTRIEQILRNEVEISVFQPTGITSAKALLLFLLRPEPKQYLEWDREHLHIDPQSFIVGATYVGLLKGRSHLETLYRPSDFDVQLAVREAQALHMPVPRNPAPVEIHDGSLAPAALATPLVAEDQSMSSPLESGPAVPMPTDQEAASLEVTPDVGGEASVVLTLADLVARLETEAPARAAMLALVHKQGWGEVVTTTFRVPHLDITPGGKSIQVTVAGLVEPEYHFDAPRLLELLEVHPVTDQTRQLVLDLYTGTKPPRASRKAQTRKTTGKRRKKDPEPGEQDPETESMPITTA